MISTRSATFQPSSVRRRLSRYQPRTSRYVGAGSPDFNRTLNIARDNAELPVSSNSTVRLVIELSASSNASNALAMNADTSDRLPTTPPALVLSIVASGVKLASHAGQSRSFNAHE